MSQALGIRALSSCVRDFVAGLKVLENEPITPVRVAEFVASERPPVEALSPYLLWNRDHYTRNLIYRDASFEILALCWLPGQRTPIHSHNGQLGWVSVLQGELLCRDYQFVRSADEDGRRFVPRSGQSGRRVEVELLAEASCAADGHVATVDRRRTTHQLENLERSQCGSVSLHIYSKPIDCCVLFDEAHRCCERRQLRYYSAHGVVIEANSLRKQAEREILTVLKPARYA